MNCSAFDFEIELESNALNLQPVVSLTCPNCGASTAIQKRTGGGIEITLDKHLMATRKA
jgi:hypothetical protein